MNFTYCCVRCAVMGMAALSMLCREPPSEPAEKKADATIFFASIPPVADVYEDGRLIGKTNVAALPVTCGLHAVTFKKDSLQFDTTMEFKAGKNPTVLVRFDKD